MPENRAKRTAEQSHRLLCFFMSLQQNYILLCTGILGVIAGEEAETRGNTENIGCIRKDKENLRKMEKSAI